MFGPVANAAHNHPTVGRALFSIGLGLTVMVYGWWRYWQVRNEKPKPPVKNMFGVSLICCVFIGFGIWEWIRALG